MLSGCVMSVCGFSLVFLAMFLCGDMWILLVHRVG